MWSPASDPHPLSPLTAPFRPQNPQDWEPYKEAVIRLYSGMELSAVIEIMERQHNFRATSNQYKKQLSKWGIAKRIKGIEYDAILRKRNERASEGKRSEILLWGEQVSIENIRRYEKNKTNRRIVREQPMLHEVATPPGLILRTPPPEEHAAFGPLVTDTTDLSEQPRHQSFDICAAPKRASQSGGACVRVASNARSPLSLHMTALQRSASPIFNMPRLCRSPSPSAEPWFRAFHQFYESGYNGDQSVTSADPMSAALRKLSCVLRTYEDEVEFQLIFRSLPVESQDCFDCRMLHFVDHIQEQNIQDELDDDRAEMFIGSMIHYALKPGGCSPETFPQFSLLVGYWHTIIQLSEEGEDVFIAGIEGLKKYGGSTWRLAMCDLTRHYFNIGKMGSAVPLVKDLLGEAYGDALWAWRGETTLEGFCCRCRKELAFLLTGVHECLHACSCCDMEARGQLANHCNSGRNQQSEVLEQWISFYGFLLLGLTKAFIVMEMDDPANEHLDQDRSNTWEIPCLASFSPCRSQCEGVMTPREVLQMGWVVGEMSSAYKENSCGHL
ncbi:hypothetical protein N431DRAFT_446031 [Stipitochalara longipes BDJ]|nr:hypothetical protein N431DRAFT_446031 [Stipitochalara longipes BDJ]